MSFPPKKEEIDPNRENQPFSRFQPFQSYYLTIFTIQILLRWSQSAGLRVEVAYKYSKKVLKLDL